MKPDLDLELPFCDEADFATPRMDTTRYVEFIEFNQRMLREQTGVQEMMQQRSRPVEVMFEIK